MSISNNFPASKPSSVLNFRSSQRLDSFLTFYSPSARTYIDSSGILRTAPPNTPVFEWDPVTGSCLGLRVWGAVTNQIRNNTGVGAVVGTPGTAPTNYTMPATSNGLSRQIVEVGQSGNIDYVDVRYSGTTTASSSTLIQPEGNTSVTAASGQSWTASTYLFVVGGSTSGINAIQQRVAGRSSTGSLLESSTVATSLATSLATSRFSSSMTFANASTARTTSDIILTYSSGAVIDITLRIGLPQLEQSATIGPVVKTTGTAASSTADVISITGADFTRIYNQSAVTLYAEATRGVVPEGDYPVMLDARTTNGLEIAQISYLIDPVAGMFARTSTGIQAELYPPIGSSVRTRRVVAAFAQDNFAVCANGGTVLTDTSGVMPTPDRINIGSISTGQFLNGYITQLSIYPSRVTNLNLQNLTR